MMYDGEVIWIAGGRSHVGTDHAVIPDDGEGPIRKLTLRPYGIGSTTVTATQFAAFVRATGYVSDAEKIGWSYVFVGLLQGEHAARAANTPWWVGLEGATWAAPTGPGSTWEADHPVVHVSHNDARAFARWAGGRLPDEAEWEHAARGGPAPRRYPWGDDEPSDENVALCNIWQGRFPTENTCKDGYYGTAPVRSFAPNSLGLYNMCGNVWEMCGNPFRIRSLRSAAKERNAKAVADDQYLLKGGSFLCHASYCWRYRIAARGGRAPDGSTSHVGFRLAFDP